jgi:hypothetical protein
VTATDSAVVKKLLADRSATEARAWLQQQDGIVRTLGESDDTAAALSLVEAFYSAGAVRVIASQIGRHEREDLEGTSSYENTGHLVVELSLEPERRRAVFRLAGKLARSLGFDPTPDKGQSHVYCMLD